MSEPILISPLLDGFLIGDPISEHNGIRCCPAIHSETNEKFIVKIMSLPASAAQLDAFLLAGAFQSQEAAVDYYQQRTEDYTGELEILQQLSRQEGFLPCEGYQAASSQDHIGFDIYILSQYRRSLERQFSKKEFTHLDALNLGLDICSALTACRRNGYLYVNLKPDNIFVTENGEYKISDLGFVKLNGLKYAAMSDAYLSEYTPPEITDAYSSINETLDVYALGMILYRIYNGGTLPENKEQPLPAPQYADEELSAILLKACSLNPEDRYESPIQMGQMLVSYMQKNGASDTPIVPPAPEPEVLPASETDTDTTADSIPATVEDACEDSVECNENPVSEISEDTAAADENADAPVEVTVTPHEPADSLGENTSDIPAEENILIANEESAPNVSFDDEAMLETAASDVEQETAEEAVTSEECSENNLMDILESHDAFNDEAAQIKAAAVYLELDNAQEPEDSSYDGITDEVSEILSMADSLAETDVPEPAVAPDAPEIALPVPEAPEQTEEETPETELESTEEDNDMNSTVKPRRSHLVRNIIIIILLLLLLAGGALFYQFIVVQTVDRLEVTGVKDQLIVQIESEADENLLTVSCEDKYGKTTVPVYNGVAEFTGLRPNSEYSIQVHIAGVHILQGDIKETHFTPNETTLLSHSVITGNEPGSAILSFTVNGPKSNRWSFTYSTPGYPATTQTFEGNSLTMTDLLPNKTYTGILTPEDDLFITKDIQIEFTASEVIQANNLKITGCSGDKLTVSWDAPESTVVDSWSVRCYSGTNGEHYDQTVTTSKTSHEFKGLKGLNSTESFTVEVTAVGQTMMQKASITANSVTVTKLTADASIDGVVNLKWESTAAPKDGWIISYTVNGSETVMTATSKEKSAVIKPVVPNTEYTFTIQSADEVNTFCDSVSVITKATEDFSIDINNKKITAADLQISLFKQPTTAQWDHTSLKSSDYTNSFAKGDKAGVLIYLKKEYEDSAAAFDATFVITNDKGEIISVASKEAVWNKAWTQNYCIFKIPALPEDAGYYTVTVYLNSQPATQQDFSIA